MKKYFWILLLIPSLCFSATGDLETIGGKVDTAISTIAGVAGTTIATICGKNYTDGDSAASCPADDAPDIDATTYDGRIYFSQTTDNHYFGTTWTAAESKQVCKVAFMLLREGDISAYTFTAKIWTLNAGALDTIIANGTSEGVAGNNAWDNTWVVFTFTGNPSVSASTTYGVTVESSTDSGTNYCSGANGAEGTPTNYQTFLWKTDQTVGTDKHLRPTMFRAYYYD